MVKLTLKTPDGTWLDWRDAWRDFGRTEEQIAAEDARRERAAQERFPRPKAARRMRTRTWGHCDALTLRMKARLAPLAGYILSALKNEFSRPSWRGKMSPRKLYGLSTAGALFGAKDAATRWRDFSRVKTWVANALSAPARHGLTPEQADAALRWLGAPNAAEPMPLPAAPAPADGALRCAASAQPAAHFTDAGARVDFNVKGKTSLHEGRAATPPASIPKFTDKKFPRRLWWVLWSHYGRFKALHQGRAVSWSGACFVSWMKACLAAGKRVADLLNLYDDALLSWHGKAADWRIRQDTLKPYGLFAELYRRAAALPTFTPQKQ